MTEEAGTPVTRQWLRTLLLGAFGAACCALALAVPEMTSARAGAPATSGITAYVTVLGLMSPVGLVMGTLVGLAVAWAGPGLLPLLTLNAPERRRFSIALSLTLPAAVGLWAVSATRATLALLTSGARPVAVGASSSLAAVGIGAVLIGAAVFGARRLERHLSSRHNAYVPLCAAASLLLGASLLVVALGETSGSGGPLDVFGVLRREELSLKPMTYLALLALAALLGTLLLRRLPNGAALGLPLLTLAALPYASQALASPELPVQILRNTALAKTPLVLLQAWTDRDGDGFGAYFGGGDCNDHDPATNPAADDKPGNGIDEDCSGGDASPIVQEETELAEPQAAVVASQLPKNLNVLFVTIDTLRHDLGFAGYKRPISPNIDALARRSIVFENAYALASYTSKSLGPLLIGRYGSETHRGWLHFNRYPKQDVMLQERLQAAGIATASVQGHWYFDVQYGLGRGFDVLDMSAAPKNPQKEGDKTVNSEQLTDAALAQLARLETASKPFFMWVHYLDPHSEYVLHEQFNFGNDQRAKYDSEVAFTDQHVGRLLEALKSSPLAANTAIILTSDHGEAFGEHGMIRHGFEVWEELVKVPLVVYVPGITPRREPAARGAIDLAPTVLDLFGLPIPGDQAEDFLSGESLAADLLLAPGEPASAREVLVDMQAGPYNGERQAYIAGGLKLVTSNSRPMGLYDLATDPGEKKNLLKDKALVQKQLDRFKHFRSKLKRVYVKPKRK